MNVEKNSIIVKISFAFLLILLLSFFFFYYIYNNAKEKEIKDFIRKGILAISSEQIGLSQKLDPNYIIIEDPNVIYQVYKNGKIILKKDFITLKIALIEYEDEKYLLINRFGIDYLIKKKDDFELHKLVIIGWILFNIIILVLYIGIIKSFYPLKILRENIKALKAGNLDVAIQVDSNDEIGFIAKEFNEAIKSLKKNEEVRKWFLRNIAHELKTPITKGKIAIELLEDEQGKKHFERIFNRLEFLVNQLLMMEKIASKNISLNFECVSIENLINQGLSLLISDEKSNVDIKILDNIKIYADINTFPIAIKNLLDNGLKFSNDNKVQVIVNDKKIIFKNKGDKPSINIEYIFEPFVKETSLKNQEGLGLGLYITKFILDMHKVNISYEYLNGENIFTLDLSQVICQ